MSDESGRGKFATVSQADARAQSPSTAITCGCLLFGGFFEAQNQRNSCHRNRS
jgi:hypothetical protein